MDTVADQVVNFLDDNDVPIAKSDIVACYTFTRKGKTNKTRLIMLKLCNQRAKINILRHAKNLKDTDVYINENLTAKNGLLAKEARLLKKQGKIEATWTRNGTVTVKRSANDKVVAVRSLVELTNM